MKLLIIIAVMVLFVGAFAAVSHAGEADVIDVEVKKIADNPYSDFNDILKDDGYDVIDPI